MGRHRLGEQLGDPSPDEARLIPGSGDDLPPDDTEEDEENPVSNPLPASVPAAEDDGSGSHSVEVSSSPDPDLSPKVFCSSLLNDWLFKITIVSECSPLYFYY